MPLWKFIRSNTKDPLYPLWGVSIISGIYLGSLFMIPIQSALEPEGAGQPLVIFSIFLLFWLFSSRFQYRSVSKRMDKLVESHQLQLLDKIRNSSASALKKAGIFGQQDRLIHHYSEIQAGAIRSFGLLSEIFLIFLPLGYLATDHAEIAGSLLIVYSFGTLLFWFNQHSISLSQKKDKNARSRVLKGLLQHAAGIESFLINRTKQKDFFEGKIKPDVEALHQTHLNLGDSFLKSLFASGMIRMLLLVALAVGLAGFQIYSIEVIFLVVAVVLLFPLERLFEGTLVVMKGNRAVMQIESWKKSLDSLASEPATTESTPFFIPSMICLENIEHHFYDVEGFSGFKLHLDRVEFSTSQIHFLTGPKGAGKTTLLKLLIGLFPIQGGEVRLNGEPVSSETFSGKIAGTFEESYRHNRVLLPERLDDSVATMLLDKMGLKKLVRFDGKSWNLDKLSESQEKRLALVISILYDRPILFFDEWAADQSPHYQKVFYEELLPQWKAQGKMVIVATQDTPYFPVADFIYRLEMGHLKIVKIPGNS